MSDPAAPGFALETSDEGTRLQITGDWTVMTLQTVEDALGQAVLRPPVTIDVSGLGRIDTAGAFLLARILSTSGAATGAIRGAHPSAAGLIAQVSAFAGEVRELERRPTGIFSLLERTGRATVGVTREMLATVAFLGETMSATVRLLLQPWKLRWTSIVALIEEAGVDALPIIAFLSFFVGMVVAFIGATTLRDFDLEIYTIELIAFSMLREFGVVLTGIVLAGRTNSSFTAQIGTMKMRQEIDAMQMIGLRTMDVLVVPRVIAMVVATPFLAFIATMAGLAGGVVVGWLTLDINPGLFLQRLRASVPIDQFWIGMSKAPVFGLTVALIACRQGLLTGGSVQSLGQRVTASVVQAIFAVIVIDALFAIFYMELGL